MITRSFVNKAKEGVHVIISAYNVNIRGHRGHDLMVVGFTTTYAISAYH